MDGLRGAFERARAANPGIALEYSVFAEFVRGKVSAEASDPGIALGALRVDALYLACAAARGDVVAIARIDCEHILPLDQVLRRFRQDAAFADEVRQSVRDRLFVGDARIGEYAGRGQLGSWIRTVALRIAIDLLRGRGIPLGGDDQDLVDCALPADDPELAAIKQQCRQEFRPAMREALLALEPAERTLLRLYYLDRLRLEELAAMLRIVPSSVSRRLATARSRVLESTRALLAERLRLSESEVESVLRVIGSHMQLPLSALAEQEPKR